MALIIEDGTGKADASSYDSIENINAYLLARGKITETETEGVYTPEITETTAIYATQSLDNLYEPTLQGERAVDGQALAFPRTGIVMFGRDVALNTVPLRIKNAIAEMCLLIASGVDVSPIIETGIKRKFEKVGPITEETEFSGSGVTGGTGVLSTVVNELKPLLKQGGASNGIIRRW